MDLSEGDNIKNQQNDPINRPRTEAILTAQNEMLKNLVTATSLQETLDMVANRIECLLPEIKCSILLMDAEGKHLHHGSGPSLPKSYTDKIDGVTIGPNIGSCACAAYTGETVIVADIETHPNWAPFSSVALEHGLRACWSAPILGAKGIVLGTFAFYCSEPKEPQDFELELIKSTAHLVGLAIENKRSQDRLKDYALELERSNNALQDFASIASHDLQEPLRKIISFSSRLQELAPNMDEQTRDYITRMDNAAQRMHRFINDLLAFSIVGTKKNPFEQVDLHKIVDQVIEDLELRIAQTKAAVIFEGLPTLEADPLLIKQLFQNLIGNSLKYHKEGTPPRITISSQVKTNNFLEIKLTDNGIGFKEKFKERVFKPFERLHGQSKYEGTGMGLAICKKIVDVHHGKIDIESEPGVGTTVTIALPIFQNPE